jgi:hypothetical protein
MASPVASVRKAANRIPTGTVGSIGAVASIVVLVTLIIRWDATISAIQQWWFLAPIFVGGYVLVVFLSEQADSKSPNKAVDRTSRRIQRQFTNFSETVVGAVLLLITMVLAAMSGALAALSGLGDAIAPIASDLGFGVLTGVGFAQLGGEFPGSGLIPTLSPMQWVLLAIIIFGIALLWEDR